jgi:hypothetical protein
MHLRQGLQKHTVSLKCNWHLYLISGTLADISQEAVGRLLRRANNRNSSGKKKRDNNPRQHDSIGTVGPVNFFCFLDIVTIWLDIIPYGTFGVMSVHIHLHSSEFDLPFA